MDLYRYMPLRTVTWRYMPLHAVTYRWPRDGPVLMQAGAARSVTVWVASAMPPRLEPPTRAWAFRGAMGIGQWRWLQIRDGRGGRPVLHSATVGVGAAGTSCRKRRRKSSVGNKSQAIASVTAVRIQLISPRGDRRSAKLPGMCDVSGGFLTSMGGSASHTLHPALLPDRLWLWPWPWLSGATASDDAGKAGRQACLRCTACAEATGGHWSAAGSGGRGRGGGGGEAPDRCVRRSKVRSPTEVRAFPLLQPTGPAGATRAASAGRTSCIALSRGCVRHAVKTSAGKSGAVGSCSSAPDAPSTMSGRGAGCGKRVGWGASLAAWGGAPFEEAVGAW